MVLAAALLVGFEGRGPGVAGHRRRRRRQRPVPPQAEVQVLFGEERLDQSQVEARHTPAVQHQDLVARTQA